MYKNILVPVDGSATSTAALREAIGLAREQKAKLVLVHVFEPITAAFSESPIDLGEALEREGRHILDQALAEAKKAGVDASGALLDSGGRRVASVIIDHAKSAGADLIALGTHGRRGIEHLLLGSVAEGVARRAEVPVLLLRGR